MPSDPYICACCQGRREEGPHPTGLAQGPLRQGQGGWPHVDSYMPSKPLCSAWMGICSHSSGHAFGPSPAPKMFRTMLVFIVINSQGVPKEFHGHHIRKPSECSVRCWHGYGITQRRMRQTEHLSQRRQSREVCTQAGAVWGELGNRGFSPFLYFEDYTNDFTRIVNFGK